MVPRTCAGLAVAGALVLAATPSRRAAAAPTAGQATPAGARPSAPSQKSPSSDLSLSAGVSRLAEAAVKDGRTAGISFVVTRGGDVLASGASGFADLENRVPAAPGTVYAIGSLTKSITAAAVLALADDGRLSLDDPLGKFLPTFPEPGRSATVAQLLNHLLLPLGLSDTRDGQSADLVPGRARGYSRRKAGGFENAWSVSLTQGYAAGALLSTAGDIATWIRLLSVKPPMSAASARAMTTPRTLSSGKTLTYGYGIGVDTFEGRRRLFHGGGLPGFDAWAAYVPDGDLAVAVLCNTDGEEAMEVADAMLRLLLARPVRP